MKFNATIEITPLELKYIIEDYLERQGVKSVSDQDIYFMVEEITRGDQRDPWKLHELTKVTIRNVRVGND